MQSLRGEATSIQVDNSLEVARREGAVRPRIALWPAVLGLALAMSIVILLLRPAHSLSYASFILLSIAALGWTIEARALAQLPVPPDEEESAEEEGPGPSLWPFILALGVAGVAAGLVFSTGYGGLFVALPLVAGSAAGWLSALRAETQMPQPSPAPAESQTSPGPPETSMAVAPGRRQPLPSMALAAQASAGAAIAVETVPSDQISRRGLLRVTFWTGLGASLAVLGAALLDMLYPRGVQGFGSLVVAGPRVKFPPGSKTQNYEGHFWLANLTPEQGGSGFLALWWKCPHLGCTVPWRPEFPFVDPATGQVKIGWFRCPCHGSTYNDAGVRVFGPAPHSMDHMAVTIDSSGIIKVDTGKVTKGTVENAKFAVPPPPAS